MERVKVIKKARPKEILVKKLKHKYRAEIESDPPIKSSGRTANSAIGGLIRANSELFGVAVRVIDLSQDNASEDALENGGIE
jgi:hypothetical protein